MAPAAAQTGSITDPPQRIARGTVAPAPSTACAPDNAAPTQGRAWASVSSGGKRRGRERCSGAGM
jgi:hypothetical protein